MTKIKDLQAKKLSVEKMYDVLRRPVVTEKSTMLSPSGVVVFIVEKKATKFDIKHCVETLYGVKVRSVNTLNVPGKTKVFRGRFGKRSDTKKAYVRLESGHSIDFNAGLKS